MTRRRQQQRTSRVPKAEYIYGNLLPSRRREEQQQPKRCKKPLVSWFRLERSRVSPGFGEAA
jgi:hypothetical protein